MAYGQIVMLGDPLGAAYAHMQVTAKPSSTSVTLKNLKDGAGAYDDNSTGALLPPATVISAAGLQGVDGTDGVSGASEDAYFVVTRAADAPVNATDIGNEADGTYFLKNTVALSVSTLTSESAATFRTSLGLGTIATQAANSVAITGGSISGITDLAVVDGGTGAGDAATARTNLSAAKSGANTDITSLANLSTPLSKAQGGTGVAALPAFSVNRGGTDQAGIATATPTKLLFNNEVFDSNTNFDTGAYRFTPTVAGYYAFTVAIQVNSLAAQGDVVQAHLYKNGAVVATAKAIASGATDNVQAVLHFVAVANGTTDYFEAFVEHDAGVNKDVEGDEEVTFFTGNWCG